MQHAFTWMEATSSFTDHGLHTSKAYVLQVMLLRSDNFFQIPSTMGNYLQVLIQKCIWILALSGGETKYWSGQSLFSVTYTQGSLPPHHSSYSGLAVILHAWHLSIWLHTLLLEVHLTPAMNTSYSVRYHQNLAASHNRHRVVQILCH